MSGALLLILPLPAYRVGDLIYLDDQACYGLDLWLENFSSVTLACPTQHCDRPPTATSPINNIAAADRLTFKELPFAYTPVSFLKSLRPTARLLSSLIDESKHLHFAIGGFWGDWGAVSALIASRKSRPYAVWTDRVESGVMAFQSSTMSGLRRLYYRTNAALASILERSVIKRSSVGLFNGMDCYTAYSSFCPNPQLVANFNFPKGSHISESQLQARLTGLAGRSLRFVYVGRAHKDKGIFDWIDAVCKTDGAFTATWFGDGPELDAAKSAVAARKLDSRITFPGPLSHDRILTEMKLFDAFLFCHKTQESPRCLIEALACGLPIVGYGSSYAEQLIAENSGGRLSPLDDIDALSLSLQSLVSNPQQLSDLSMAAARDGLRFNSEEAFRHRSDLIKLIGSSAKSGFPSPFERSPASPD